MSQLRPDVPIRQIHKGHENSPIIQFNKLQIMPILSTDKSLYKLRVGSYTELRWKYRKIKNITDVSRGRGGEHFRGVHRQGPKLCQCTRKSFVTLGNGKHEFSLLCTICTMNDCREPKHKSKHDKLVGRKTKHF